MNQRVVEAALPFVGLDWDSQFFGRRIARVTRDAESAAQLEAMLHEARAARIDCLYYLLEPTAAAALAVVESAGYQRIDDRVTLEGETRLDVAARSATRPARAEDAARLRDIAGRGHCDTRFYRDRRFPRELCASLYATWIERSLLHGLADHVLTIDADGAPVGYVTCSARDGAGTIGLFAVAESARGRGYGRTLLAAALDCLARQGVARVGVVTQGTNATAQGIYQRLGFRSRDVKLWYHLWLSGEGPVPSHS